MVSKTAVGRELEASRDAHGAAKWLTTLRGRRRCCAICRRTKPATGTRRWLPGRTAKRRLTFTLPDRSTGWTLLAKGITQDTLGGEASQEFTVRKDLFGELKCAAAFTDGDKTEVVVSVHNDAVEKGEIEVALDHAAGRQVDHAKPRSCRLPPRAFRS